MTSAPTTSSGDLTSVVRAFAETHPETLDASACRDTCINVSNEFVDALAAAGVSAEMISGIETGEVAMFPGEAVILGAHAAVLVGGLVDGVVYDWTARQFDSSADVPLMQSVEQWRERWASIGGGA